MGAQANVVHLSSADIERLINPRPEGYCSRFVVRSICPPCYREQHSLHVPVKV